MSLPPAVSSTAATPPAAVRTRPTRSASTASRRSILAHELNAGVGGGAAAYDLPSSDLELSQSLSRSSLGRRAAAGDGFRGGQGLGLSQSNRASRRGAGGAKDGQGRQQDGIVEEGEEELQVELDAAEQRADLKYGRFSEKRKSCIVAIVAFAALLARESYLCDLGVTGVGLTLTLGAEHSLLVVVLPPINPSDL